MMIEGTFTMVHTNLYYWKLMTSLSLQDEIWIRIKEKFAVRRMVGMQQTTHLFEEMEVEDSGLEAYFFGSAIIGCLR